MILFDLHCASGHVFEAWFRDNASYDAQCASGQIACPCCGDTEVGKAPMSPRILGASQEGARQDSALTNVEAGETLRLLEALKREIEQHFKDVGADFPEEARKMHYGESPSANLRGTASPKEMHELWEEGIPALPLPVSPKKMN